MEAEANKLDQLHQLLKDLRRDSLPFQKKGDYHDCELCKKQGHTRQAHYRFTLASVMYPGKTKSIWLCEDHVSERAMVSNGKLQLRL